MLHLLSVDDCHLIKVSAVNYIPNPLEFGNHHITTDFELVLFGSVCVFRSFEKLSEMHCASNVDGNLGGCYLATTPVNTRTATSFLSCSSNAPFDSSMSEMANGVSRPYMKSLVFSLALLMI